jgi:hypothetical protein
VTLHARGASNRLNYQSFQNQTVEDGLERLKQTQAAYFDSLTAGDYGPDYILHRLRVGIVHQRIGLGPQWYWGAYSKCPV